MAWMTRKQVRSQPVQSYSERQLQKLLDAYDRAMGRLNDQYLRAMGEHIRDIGTMWPSDVHRLQQIRRMNKNLRQLQRRIGVAAGRTESEIGRIFQKIAEEDVRMQQKILGVPDILRIENNKPLQRILQAQARETAERMRNLSNTTVVSKYYRDAVDEAVTAVQSGVEDYNTAIRRVIREAGEHGMRVTEEGTRKVDYESGWSRRLDTAARMNVLDGVRHLNQSIMEEVSRQFGANGVEIDAHMLCAEDHLPYQGGQYSNEEFEEIQDSLDRPFGEWNCRHSWHGIILGVSPPTYTPDQLDQMQRYSTEMITIDGRTKTRYQWSQEMRRMETAVRQQKDTANLARATGDDKLRLRCQGTILQLNQKYEALANKAGLQPEFQRTYVAGFKDAKAGMPPVPGAADAVRNTFTPVCYDPNATYAINLAGYSSAVNDGLSAAMRDLAIKGTETGNEHMYLVNLRTGNRDFYETNENPGFVGYEFRTHLREHEEELFAFVHNHNTDGSLSETDMQTLLTEQQIPIMIAVRNDGVIYVAERKGDILSSVNFDALYAEDLKVLRDQLKAGIISMAQRTKRRELIIVENLLRDYTKGGHLIEYDTRQNQ